MEQTFVWAGKAWEHVVHFFANLTLGMALWLGLLLLTLVLLFLMCTRWGGVKPIWKCVILSIFAHVLLGGYAYGTKLIFTSPEKPSSELISLNLIESDSPDNDAEHSATTQTNPWDELDLSPQLTVPTEEVQRLQPTVQKTVTRTQPQIAPHQTQPQVPKEVKGHLAQNAPVQTAAVSQDDLGPQSGLRTKTQAQSIKFQRQSRTENQEIISPDSPDSGQTDRLDSIEDEKLQSTAERATPQPVSDHPTDRKELLKNLAHATDIPDESALSKELSRQVQGTNRLSNEDLWGRESESDYPFQAATAPRRLADGSPMPELYSGRSPEARKKKASKNGGSAATERAVTDALHWLAAKQEQDGSWQGTRFGAGQERLVLGHNRQGAGTNSDMGLTGLTLLSFLAAGHSHLEGDYKQTVQKGLEYLLNQQARNGDMAGNAKLFARMYCHAMATLAITETLAMTGDKRLKEPVSRAVQYSLNAQNPTYGGWRYRPGDDGDMSQFGWQVLVLKNAELGGIDIPDRSKLLMQEFLRRCSSGNHSGIASYRAGLAPSVTMTAEALVCRHFLHDNLPSSTVNEASQYLLTELPGAGEENLYYWYYGTLAMFQTGGQAWETWNHHLTQTLTSSQNRDGDNFGSWDPTGKWAGYGGRIYSTAMATLCLEVYYRYDSNAGGNK